MITPADATLARLAVAAYDDNPALPPGFAAAPLALDPGLYQGGVYRLDNGAALAATGLLDGRQTLVLAFRGTDDDRDARASLTGSNADHADFAALVAAADAYAATGAVQQVVATGHSLGGAHAQLYVASHPGQAGGPAIRGETFGSAGATLQPAPDARVENVVIADDPAVFAATHRADIAGALRADPRAAEAAATWLATQVPGLTEAAALAILPGPIASTVNRGTLVVLPGADGRIEPSGLLRADPARHEAALYLAATEAAAAGSLPMRAVPVTPTTPEETLWRAIHAGDAEADVSFLLDDARGDLEAWGRDVLASARDSVDWL